MLVLGSIRAASFGASPRTPRGPAAPATPARGAAPEPDGGLRPLRPRPGALPRNPARGCATRPRYLVPRPGSSTPSHCRARGFAPDPTGACGPCDPARGSAPEPREGPRPSTPQLVARGRATSSLPTVGARSTGARGPLDVLPSVRSDLNQDFARSSVQSCGVEGCNPSRGPGAASRAASPGRGRRGRRPPWGPGRSPERIPSAMGWGRTSGALYQATSAWRPPPPS